MSIRDLVLFLVLSLFCIPATAQVFFQESFESTDGWTLSHTFDDDNDDYSKRDSVSALDELGYTLFGHDGIFAVAFEDTDAEIGLAPEDGIISLSIDPIDISGVSIPELVLGLSCNSEDEAYDERAQDNGDYLDVEVNIDGGGWQNIASFCSAANGGSSSTLFHDVNGNGNGGELGEGPLGNGMTNFVLPLGGTGNSASIRFLIRMNGSDEVLVLDNVRMKESEGDVSPPTVNNVQLIDGNSIQIQFNEEMNNTAEQLFRYSGISGLVSATLQSDGQTVLLEYGSDFDLGEAYQLLIFGVQDLAGNSMSGAYAFPFYWNPTTPDLVITEIMYNDPSLEDSLEFIEIYNHGSSQAIVGGFRIEGGVEHTLASVSLEPGEFYLVARNAMAAEGFYNLSFYDYGGQLSDNSEEILLYNAQGTLLDSVTYNDNVPWPSAGDGFGPSIELVSPDAANEVGSNWSASSNELAIINGMNLAATPGALPGTILPVVQFDNNDLAVIESDGVIEFTAYVAASNSVQSVVEIEVIGGTASSSDHGASTIETLQLPANSDGEELIAFSLVNDPLVEGVEYFTLQMTASSNCQIGLNNQLTIIIADDDQELPELYINELQSDNSTSIADEAGEYDDWFEIFNPGDQDVDLAGYYLSDDITDPLQDRIPVGSNETVVPAHGFLLFWADDDGDQGPRHMNFKLSGAGEQLILTSPMENQTLDQIEFGALIADQSYGRFCDAGSEWTVYSEPTPASSNCPNAVFEIAGENIQVQIFAGYQLVLEQEMNYRLLDVSGRTLSQAKERYIDISQLPAGIYLLYVEGSNFPLKFYSK